MIDYVISSGFMVFIVYNRQGNVNNNHVIIEYDFGFVVIIYQGYLYFWHCIDKWRNAMPVNYIKFNMSQVEIFL